MRIRSIFAPHVPLLVPTHYNSAKLEEALKLGAKIVERPTWYGDKIKRNLRLVWDDGTYDHIQYSTIAPLIKRGVVKRMFWVGNQYVYYYLPNLIQHPIIRKIREMCP